MRSYKKLIFPLFTLLNLTVSLAMEEEKTRKRSYDATLETSEDKGGFDEQEETGSSVKKPRRNPTDLSSVESYELSPCLSGMPREILSDILNYVFEDMNDSDVYRMGRVCREFRDTILSLGKICTDYKGRPALIANKNVERFVQLTERIRNTDNKNSSEEIAIVYFCLGDLYLMGTFKTPNYQKALDYYNESYQHGFEYAYARKGLMYEEGVGVLKDMAAANYHYEEVGGGSSSEMAVYTLANWYWGAYDYSKAYELFNKVANQGYPDAQFKLGVMYQEGMGVEKNDSIAAQWYLKAAEQDHSDAQLNLALLYEEGSGVEKNGSIAAHWYTRAAHSGGAASQYKLATMYEEGMGVERNFSIAAYWYLRAAALNIVEAYSRLGSMYYDGNGVERNFSIAAHWYTRAAHSGGAASQYKLATMYEEGMGVERNFSIAAHWYARAAHQGDAASQYKLATMYEKGMGVEKDDLMAAYWYLRAAASRGNVDALLKLGGMYEKGRGVTKNETKAFHYYEAAADKNHSFGILNMAYCLERGIGTAPNLQEANEMYAKVDEATKAEWRQFRGIG